MRFFVLIVEVAELAEENKEGGQEERSTTINSHPLKEMEREEREKVCKLGPFEVGWLSHPISRHRREQYITGAFHKSSAGWQQSSIQQLDRRVRVGGRGGCRELASPLESIRTCASYFGKGGHEAHAVSQSVGRARANSQDSQHATRRGRSCRCTRSTGAGRPPRR